LGLAADLVEPLEGVVLVFLGDREVLLLLVGELLEGELEALRVAFFFVGDLEVLRLFDGVLVGLLLGLLDGLLLDSLDLEVAFLVVFLVVFLGFLSSSAFFSAFLASFCICFLKAGSSLKLPLFGINGAVSSSFSSINRLSASLRFGLTRASSTA